jgi:hypothetical protein
MKKLLLPIAILSLVAYADDAKINKSEESVKIKKEKKVDKADELITNRRFRASNGSLSKLSMNTSLTYSAGSIDKPFDAERPNISNAGDTTSIAGMSGTVNASYRLNTLNRINAGAGLQMLAPFNDSIDTKNERAQKEFDDNRGELEVNNPYVSYSHFNKFFGVQTILSGSITQYTAGNFTDLGYQNRVSASINTMYDFGGSPFSIGVLGVYDRFYYDGGNYSDGEKANQADVVWGFLPQAEYVINDTFNIRTIMRSNWYQNSMADHEFSQRPITQSVGLGISVNRDIFLYPNLQFVVEDAQASNTNIGLSANINMF